MSPRLRVIAATGTALTVAVLGLLVFLILELGRASDRIGSLNTADVSRDRAIAALASGDSQLRAQVKSLGGTPNVPPPQVVVSSIPGAQGPGPSDAQVQGAVDTYLAAHPPTATVSALALTTVVAAYLAQHPPAPGPPPSDTQVSAAVAPRAQRGARRSGGSGRGWPVGPGRSSRSVWPRRGSGKPRPRLPGRVLAPTRDDQRASGPGM